MIERKCGGQLAQANRGGGHAPSARLRQMKFRLQEEGQLTDHPLLWSVRIHQSVLGEVGFQLLWDASALQPGRFHPAWVLNCIVPASSPDRWAEVQS